MTALLLVLLGITVAIFFHELGHFWIARRRGVKVERFSIGFGPELFGLTRSETRFSVCAIPVGGYVKMAGEDPAASGERLRGEEFYGQPWPGRLLIAFAGPAGSVLFAFGLFWVLRSAWPSRIPSEEPVVGRVLPDSPAEKAGLKAGDRITAIAGRPVRHWKDMTEAIRRNPQLEIEIRVERGGREIALKAVPARRENTGTGFLGIESGVVERRLGPLEAVPAAARECYEAVALTVTAIGRTIRRQERLELAGPIGIGTMLWRAASHGLEPFLYLMGLVSANLGVLNLLPLPGLDGGHIFFCFLEGIRRRRMSVRSWEWANRMGLAFLVALILFATYSDFVRLLGGGMP